MNNNKSAPLSQGLLSATWESNGQRDKSRIPNNARFALPGQPSQRPTKQTPPFGEYAYLGRL
jgi:hypothetical protein